jgi:hypothetical protein
LACRTSARRSACPARTTAATAFRLVQQWDAKAKKWNLITDWIQSDKEVIDALMLEDSEAFAAEKPTSPSAATDLNGGGGRADI